MKYFLHDTSASDDEKIIELFIEFGYEGLGLFYVILEKIAKQEKPVKTSVLKAQLKVGKKLDKCWTFMESLGLISSNNGETFNKQLLNYAETYKIKKEKNAKRISEWRDNQEDTENVTRSEQVGNAPKVKVSKGIVNKGKGIKDKLFEVLEISDAEKVWLIPNNNFSNEAKEIWLTLCKTAKWKKKEISALEYSLKQLLKYEEGFAIILMSKAIAGGYQGVVYGSADLEYDKWKQGIGTKQTDINPHNGLTEAQNKAIFG